MGLYVDMASFFVLLFIIILLYLLIQTKNDIKLFQNKELQKYIIICIIFILIFFIYAKLLEQKYDKAFVQSEGNSKLYVKIVSNKEKGNYYDNYVGEVKSKKNKNLRILIYAKDVEFEYGDIIEVSGEISKPSKARNQGGFDYSQYLRQKKISAIILVEKYEKVSFEKDLFFYIYRLKEICLQRIEGMYENEQIGFLNAILFGETTYLDEEIRENFKLSNLSHVLAISGMHITCIIIGIEKFLKLFIKSFKLRNIVIIIFLTIFIPFVGASASVIRACIMSIIAYIAKLILEKDDFYSSFCIALFILLVINPYNINSISMWLSFGGSIGIVAFNNFLNRILIKKIKILKFESNHKIQNCIKKLLIKSLDISIVSISAQIIIFPIMLYYFNTISITFWISNILISWLINPILILGYMSVILYPIGIIISYIEKNLIQLLFLIVQICARIPFNQIFLPTISLYAIILYYCCIFCFVHKFNKNKFHYLRKIFIKNNTKILKKILVYSIIVILISNLFNLIPSELKINFLDVGQGDCALVRTKQNKIVLIDSGEGNGDKYDYGEKVVFPYLLDNKIMKIDYMIISHFDSDHARWNVLYFRKYESRKNNNRQAG